jgi:hypothetical protein
VSEALAVVIDVTLGVILLVAQHVVTTAATGEVAAASAARCKGREIHCIAALNSERHGC